MITVSSIGWRHVIVDIITLESGLRVAWDRTPAHGTSALGLFIDVGSRDESRLHWGAAHFLEHAAFKGAGTRNARDIAETSDRLGAEVNAFTTRDYTCFYGKAMDPMLASVGDLVRMMVQEPWLAADDIDRERTVIVEEMRESRDDAADQVEEVFLRALYPGAGFHHDILGSEETIHGLTAAVLKEFHHRFYVPERMVLAVAGNAGSDLLDDQAAAAAPPPLLGVRPIPRVQPVEILVDEDREQVQLMLGVAAPWINSTEVYTCDLLTTLLGGQTSSRLWQRLREDDGLVYSVNAEYQAEPDWAAMTISLAVHPDRLEAAVAAIGEELRLAIDRGFSDDEVCRAKIQLRAGLWFGSETVDHRMLRLGRHLLMGRVPPAIADLEARIEAVSQADLSELTRSLWADFSHIAVAAVGPISRWQGFRHLL